MSHTEFVTTGRGLRRDIPPMRLYEKAKRLGIWNPSEIDLSQDKRDWLSFSAPEKDLVLRLTSLFQAGEEAVTLDLLPLIMAIAEEGRLEEEMFLTTFLFEEAKHTDFFARFLTDVAGVHGNLEHYHSPNYQAIFYEALPEALNRLRVDRSPEAQVIASATYNMIVEGVLAETGYHAYYTMLAANKRLPGVQKGIAHLKQDESRHIAYGIFLISRLIAENDSLWQVLEDQMNTLFLPAVGVIADGLAPYNPIPFGLEESVFVDYAVSQFNKRMDRIEKARGASLDEIYRVTQQAIDTDEA